MCVKVYDLNDKTGASLLTLAKSMYYFKSSSSSSLILANFNETHLSVNHVDPEKDSTTTAKMRKMTYLEKIIAKSCSYWQSINCLRHLQHVKNATCMLWGSEFPHPGCDPLPRYRFYHVSGRSHY